ncbi:Aldose 1-epimerase [Candidatus Izimaplasma bacterium HR1]|jgi:galactose mutarotase-like enzyme|uniref:aldose 1-epimerase family protein n=1 Tax=Candidatus Izimoplasma sp. HR1 TaxID=1541959 RepID=UPI0004F83162|nr:Aldose 1-epimerase [Candidatus Izimaplasma bacterium HR1]
MNITLKNKTLEVEIDAFGAELKSIQYNDIEYLWQGDPEYWKRNSPVLFPIVGRLLDDEYIYEDKTYKLTQHGFARDMQFELLESSDNKVLFLLRENETSLQRYPFTFNLFIGYEVIDNRIVVTWKVENTNDKEMYFQIGAHPAFNFLNGSYIDINKVTNQYLLEGTPYVQDITANIKYDSIEIDNTTFTKDAIVVDNIDYITLRDDTKSVSIHCNNFPFLGLWTKLIDNENAPFICLEPWHGIADFSFHDKQLVTKKGINILQKGEIFNATYYIELK